MLDTNTNVEVILTDVLNTGNVTIESESGSHDGGIIGTTNAKQNGVFVLTNVTNTGNITVDSADETSSASGLIGRMEDKADYDATLTLSDCVNTGTVEHKSARACGLFALVSDGVDNTETHLSNCANKGDVSGSAGSYGIANTVTRAKTVLSIGRASSKQFWETGEGEGLYGVERGGGDSPDGTVFIAEDRGTGFFKTQEGEWADVLLNARLRAEGRTTRWTSSLDLSRRITLSVGRPLDTAVDGAAGNTLQRTAELGGLALDGFVCVDGETGRVLDGSTVLRADTRVVPSHWLTVRGAASARTPVAHGTRLGDTAVLGAFFGDPAVGVFDASSRTLCREHCCHGGRGRGGAAAGAAGDHGGAGRRRGRSRRRGARPRPRGRRARERRRRGPHRRRRGRGRRACGAHHAHRGQHRQRPRRVAGVFSG